jgi:hypothetical protein
MAYSAPSTRTTGFLVTAAVWNQDIVDNQNAAFPLGVAGWTSYTPTLTQNATVTKTVTYAKYQRVGRTIFFIVELLVTGTGTASNAIIVGLPVTAASANKIIGSGIVFDTSATALYKGLVNLLSTTTVALYWTGDTTVSSIGVVGMSAGLAVNDQVQLSGFYEAAT